MPMSDDLDFDVLERVFSGEATPEESMRVEQWIASRSDRREVIEALRRLWRNDGRLARTWDVAGMWEVREDMEL